MLGNILDFKIKFQLIFLLMKGIKLKLLFLQLGTLHFLHTFKSSKIPFEE